MIANAFAESSPERAIRAPVQKEMKFLLWTIRVPDNARYRMRLTSRFLAMFPFLMEVWYWLLTWVRRLGVEGVELTRVDRYWVYQIARACQALTMGANTRSISERHARQIISVQRWLHIDVELALQHFVMKREWLLIFFNK